MPDSTDRIKNVCETHWAAWKDDCSGFAKAVSKDLAVSLSGQANEIIDYLESSPVWVKLGTDSETAMLRANSGDFVIAGLKAKGHDHVVVLVRSGVSKWPIGYWGRFGAVGRKNTSINWSWNKTDLPNVAFYATKI